MQQIPLQQTTCLILYDGICGWCRDCVRCVSKPRPLMAQIYHRPENIESLGGVSPSPVSSERFRCLYEMESMMSLHDIAID